jgi:hypothetical protein
LGGVAYIAIHYLLGPRIAGTPDYEQLPLISFYGDPFSTGRATTLREYAPGDVPCRPYCRTGEEIFNAVKGSIDLILRNSLR